MLEFFGLDAFTEQVYRVLLRNRMWGVSEMASHLGVRESQIRAALDRLAESSLIVSGSPDSSEYDLPDPGVSLGRALERSETELLEQHHRIREVSAAIARLSAEYATTNGYSVAERLPDADAVMRRLMTLIRHARLDYQSLVPARGRAARMSPAVRRLDRLAIERGVVIRRVYQDSLRPSRALAEEAKLIRLSGGQVRTAPRVPMPMIIIDQATLLIPGDQTPGAGPSIALVSSAAIVAGFLALFDAVWTSASAVGKPLEADDAGLTPFERQLLGLLSEGCTDQRAAHKLGVSLRTVRRTVSDLKLKVGAQSRFEAGFRIAQNGWL
jgi:DNA-binding CsgD family transcriptional regulator